MAYTLNQGVDNGGLDRVQRGLLWGLPALVLVLTISALIHHSGSNNPAGNNAKTIPIVASLSTSADKPDNTKKSNSSSSTSASTGSTGTASGTTQAAASSAFGTSSSGGTGTTPVVGGRGGVGGGSTGVTIPDCSLNQIATVTCRVPACSPEVTLAPGQKAILGVGTACVVVN